MSGIKVYIGDKVEREHRIVTEEEGDRQYLKLQFEAENGSVTIGNREVLECSNTKRETTDTMGTTSIYYKDMTEGDEVDITYFPSKKMWVGDCEDVSVQIFSAAREEDILYRRERTHLYLQFVNFKRCQDYYDYIMFRQKSTIPALIIDTTNSDKNDCKWFLADMILQPFRDNVDMEKRWEYVTYNYGMKLQQTHKHNRELSFECTVDYALQCCI